MRRVRAVTFDAGGTLIDPWPSVGAIYAEVAREFGLECAPARLDTQFLAAWRSRSRFNYTPDEWFAIVRSTFEGLCDVSPAMFDVIYDRFRERRAWRVYQDVLPTLLELQANGIRVAVISNWDDRLRPLLETLELAPHFDEIAVSAVIGAHKPNPKIFEWAVSALGVEPGETLHVGDSEREDVSGAREAGLEALRIRRSGRAAEHDITTLTEIVERIGTAQGNSVEVQ
jgi:putative hydrolase of the HAD superfamily